LVLEIATRLSSPVVNPLAEPGISCSLLRGYRIPGQVKPAKSNRGYLKITNFPVIVRYPDFRLGLKALKEREKMIPNNKVPELKKFVFFMFSSYDCLSFFFHTFNEFEPFIPPFFDLIYLKNWIHRVNTRKYF